MIVVKKGNLITGTFKIEVESEDEVIPDVRPVADSMIRVSKFISRAKLPPTICAHGLVVQVR